MLARRVPAFAQQTAKQGFTPPLNRWIDGPLRGRIRAQMAEPTWHLDVARSRRPANPADPGTLARHWNLWTVLALEWWLARLDGLPKDFVSERTR